MSEILSVKIGKIKPNPKNPRTIRDEKFEKLKKSIQDFPDMLSKRPLICFTDTDSKLVVLGGNMRLKAAHDLGLKELPVILADTWTEDQKAEFLIKDNVGFGGSGTTMVACHQMQRKAYIVELDPKYCQVIVDRMLKLDPTLTVKRNGLAYVKQPNYSREG